MQLPPYLETMGNGTLLGADGVATIDLPATLAGVGDYAMAGMTGLKTVTSAAATVPAVGNDVWWGVNQGAVTLKVPAEAVNDYKSAPQWQDFLVTADMLPGDVNQDGKVDVGDINSVLAIILTGGTSDAALRARADVNNDDNIDVGDVNAILAIILAQKAARRHAATRRVTR